MPSSFAHVPVTWAFCLSFERATLIPTLSLEGPFLIFPRDLLFITKSQLKHLLLSETFQRNWVFPPHPRFAPDIFLCVYLLVCSFSASLSAECESALSVIAEFAPGKGRVPGADQVLNVC